MTHDPYDLTVWSTYTVLLALAAFALVVALAFWVAMHAEHLDLGLDEEPDEPEFLRYPGWRDLELDETEVVA